MKKILLVGLLFLAACAKVDSSKSLATGSSDGIIGGQIVADSDPLAQTTVQIFTFQLGKDETGQVGITGVAGCTGTIISDKVIMSAAHCLAANARQSFVYFSDKVPTDLVGFFSAYFKDPTTQKDLRQVQGALVGDNWIHAGQEEKNWDDISLLKFDGGLPTGYKVAELVAANTQINNKDVVTLAGFGLTSPMIDGVKPVSTTALRSVNVSVKDAQFSVDELMIATGNGSGSCHGDSGGPAYLNQKGKSVVVGITSRADFNTDPKGQCTGLTVYTNVQHFLGWIATNRAKLELGSFTPQPIPQPQESEQEVPAVRKASTKAH